MSTDTMERNKQAVQKLYTVIYGSGDNLDLLDELVAEDYVQHNPSADQGREGLRRFFTEFFPLPLTGWLGPEATIEVNYIAEGDRVVRHEIRTHGLLIDIFRVEDGIITEHWDAYRPNPGTERIPSL